MTSKQRKQRRLRDARAAGTTPSQLRRDRAAARRVAASLNGRTSSVLDWARNVMLESTAKGITAHYDRVGGGLTLKFPGGSHFYLIDRKPLYWHRALPPRRRYRTR